MTETSDFEERKQELELQKLELEIKHFESEIQHKQKSGRTENIRLIATLGAVVVPLLIGMGTMFVQLTNQITEIKREETKTQLRVKKELTTLLNELLSNESLEANLTAAKAFILYGADALPVLTEAMKSVRDFQVSEQIIASILLILQQEPDYRRFVVNDLQNQISVLREEKYLDYGLFIHIINLITRIAEQDYDGRESVVRFLVDLRGELPDSWTIGDFGQGIPDSLQIALYESITKLREGHTDIFEN